MGQQNKPKKDRVSVLGIIGFFMVIIGFICAESDEGMAIASIGCVMMLIGVFATSIRTNREKKDRINQTLKLCQEDCVNHTWNAIPILDVSVKYNMLGITDTTEANYQRMRLALTDILNLHQIPEQYHEHYLSRAAHKYYLSQIELQKNQAEQLKENRIIDELKKQEEEKCREYIEYAQYIGKDKSIAYSRYQMDKFRFEFEEGKKAITSLTSGTFANSFKMQEKNAYGAAGWANAINGSGAAMCTYLETQAENEKIRQHNQNVDNTIGKMGIQAAGYMHKGVDQVGDLWIAWEKNYEKAKVLLTQTQNGNRLLSALSIIARKQQITKTGAVELEISISQQDKSLSLYGVSAVVDGSVKVLLQINGKTVGTTICVLPFGGSVKYNMVKCICTNVSQKADKYDVIFEPNHLWLQEKVEYGTLKTYQELLEQRRDQNAKKK